MKNLVKQIIFFTAFLAVLVGSWWLVPTLKIWAIMWSIIAVVVIGVEVYSKIKTGRTISQVFCKYRDSNLGRAWLLVISMIVAVLMLAWHLMSGAYINKKKG